MSDMTEVQVELQKVTQVMLDIADSQRKLVALQTPPPPPPSQIVIDDMQSTIDDMQSEIDDLHIDLEVYENKANRLRNIDVAGFLIDNALAYVRDHCLRPEDRLEIARANMQEVDACLKRPFADNTDHKWNDFK